ncbi:CLUMA_CG011850, isoform A, partial [Clunio marinus]
FFHIFDRKLTECPVKPTYARLFGLENRKFSVLSYKAQIMRTSVEQNNSNGALSSPKMIENNLNRYDDIVKSQEDKRLYRGLKLSNGMKVLLVSDATTDKSAACLCVEVGHMSDPTEIPGIAHFCEHMLFLGTKKYPDENGYSSFLSKNGGTSNAATYPDVTKYYFDVVPEKLDEALDRFSQFFLAPLFTESATLREINAVNSEHEKNLSTDVWRIRQVNKSLANPEHPYSKFGTGNKETLLDIPKEKGIDIRSELIKFHKNWYSSNIMNLAIFGKESLDELEKMTLKYFSDVEDKNVEVPKWSDEIYLEDQKAIKLCIVPVKDSRSLTISFQIPDLDEHYRCGPEHYISHLVGHEGSGSILSELKSRGWCNNLVGGASSSAKGFGFFEIMVDLTEEGINYVDEILKLIFQYLNMLKREGPQKWIFDEYVKLHEMQFRFKDKENPLNLVSNVVHSMLVYPLPEVLSANYLLTEWKPLLIENVMERLNPYNARIILVGQNCKEICTKSEPWYKTSYSFEKIEQSAIDGWLNCGINNKLRLPDRNPLIPTNFSLLTIEDDNVKHPEIVHDTPLIRVWFKQDTEFLKPKNFIGIDFSNPIVYTDPLNCNLTHLFVQLFKDTLTEFLYSAELAGLRLTISNTTNGISMLINGYSEKQNIFLEAILDKMFNFEVDEKRFGIMCEQYIRGLKNFNAEQPYQLAIYYLAVILTEQAWTKKELVDAMALVTFDRLKTFITDVMSRMHAECFIYGNVNKEKALELSTLVENQLKKTNAYVLPQLSRQLLLKREYKLNERESYLFECTNEFHKAGCASLYLQCGVQEDNSNVFLDLVSQIMSEPCYNILRTQEQLGYIVFSGVRKANGAKGLRILVQSTKHPEFVESRIENFLNLMITEIDQMSLEEFERHKEALKAQKLEKPKRLSSQYSHYMNEISLQQYHFDRSEKEVEIMSSITKEQVLEYYKLFIVPDAASRQTLSIHILSDPSNVETADIKEQAKPLTATKQKISDLTGFKSSKQLYPMAKSFINVIPKGARSKL